jgi:hypothetical protein
MTPPRDEARERLAAAVRLRLLRLPRKTAGEILIAVGLEDLKALISGPPEPSEEEVAQAIKNSTRSPMNPDELECARRVQALYRSRRNG